MEKYDYIDNYRQVDSHMEVVPLTEEIRHTRMPGVRRECQKLANELRMSVKLLIDKDDPAYRTTEIYYPE